ncbi:gala protein [Dactylosporangium sp. NPDC049140]|uniref:gala protein n=1 Tax=Dactylosporangium sp. NPDC049140 TaxID=3155647 RepID=UPI00340DE91F
MVEPGIEISCPVMAAPAVPTADLALLEPLLARLSDPAGVAATERFPLGTLQPDGRLDLCKQGLGADGVSRVLDRVVGSAHAVHLLLGTNGLGAPGTAALAASLAPGHGVETLYLGCNAIDASGAEPLFERLAGDDTVTALWLKRNPLGDDGIAALAAALRTNTALSTLDLVNTGLTTAGLALLVDALAARERPVARVFLGGNGLGPSAAPLLRRLLAECGVTGLFLAANRLGDEGAGLVVEGISRDGTTLGLGGNGLTDVAPVAARLGRLEGLDLSRPLSLRVLGAVDNTIGDAGARVLAEALPGSPLRRLDLRHTGVRGRGAKALLAAVETGRTGLRRLTLGPDVPRRVKRRLAELLAGDEPPFASEILSVYR